MLLVERRDGYATCKEFCSDSPFQRIYTQPHPHISSRGNVAHIASGRVSGETKMDTNCCIVICAHCVLLSDLSILYCESLKTFVVPVAVWDL